MNILLFTQSLAGGGTERTVATLANHWTTRGWEVTVATLAPQAEDFYGLHPAVARVALDLAGPSGNPIAAARQNLRRVRALRRLLERVRPGVAVAMMSTPNVLLALAGRGLPGLVAVGSEHCYPPHAPLGRLWSAARRRTYGRLGAVVALTDECRCWIETHTSARSVPVIPNAVACPLPSIPPRIAPDAVLAPGRKVLLAAGRLDPVKNLEALLAAFARLAPVHPDWDLVLLGDGPERGALHAAIGALGLGGRVVLPGIAGNVGEWHARADLYVLTSHSEGFPNALAEALCHGVPAVSVDCDTGPRDIVRHGVDGLLVAPGDPAALAQALGQLMGDGALRRQFAARAAEARERFSIERIAALWEALFVRLAATQAAAARGAGAASRQEFLS
ncbi:MAG: glycosyltransferase [Massilia sp.]|jgi:glycosyltransferase involved in cell wall biosynthesis